jgi:hypothetical protein
VQSALHASQACSLPLFLVLFLSSLFSLSLSLSLSLFFFFFSLSLCSFTVYLVTSAAPLKVLGTVDQPQLHDIVWEYVKLELAGDAFKRAQRRLVELFRHTDGDAVGASLTGYLQHEMQHHVRCAYDSTWATSAQAFSWLDDHHRGVQHQLAFAIAGMLPTQQLAEAAEADGQWWSAALRWSCTAAVVAGKAGYTNAGGDQMKRAVAAAERAFPITGVKGDKELTQYNKDVLLMNLVTNIVVMWNTCDYAMYAPKLHPLVRTEAALANPIVTFKIYIAIDFYEAALVGNHTKIFATYWNMLSVCVDACNSDTVNMSEETRLLCKGLACTILAMGFDPLIQTHGIEALAQLFGKDGQHYIEFVKACEYDQLHRPMAEIFSQDAYFSRGGGTWPLLLHYGSFEDASEEMEKSMENNHKILQVPESMSYKMDLASLLCTVPVLLHLFGRTADIGELYRTAGVTLAGTEDMMLQLMEGISVFRSLHCIDPAEPGFFSKDQFIW